MTIINLNEWAKERGFSNYHVRCWIKNGLKTIRQRPYITTLEALESFFEETLQERESKKIASKKIAYRNMKKKLDFNDYLREEFKWKL